MKKPHHRALKSVSCAFLALILLAPGARAEELMPDHDTSGHSALEHSAIEQAGNPPLPEEIAPTISNEDLLIAPELVLTEEGEVKDVATGEAVTDPAIVGTSEEAPDPLAKMGGRRFIPIEIGDIRAQDSHEADLEESSSPSTMSPASASSATTIVKDGAFQATTTAFTKSKSPYGAYWSTYSGEPAFFDGNGQLFAQQATTVIDVSQWQGAINWEKVKASEVDAAIIRVGYSDEGVDTTALANIAECKRLGIPFGVYLFSYAENAEDGKAEAKHILSLLKQADVTPSTLSYPVFYDLERWAYGTNPKHVSPTTSAAYEEIVNAWWSTMRSAGFEDLSLYSYTDMLKNELKSNSLHSKTHWAASYGATVAFDFPENYRGWQYTNAEEIPGITANVVDVSAFGNGNWKSDVNLTWIYRDEDIAVGASLAEPYSRPTEYRFMEYNVAEGKWRTFADWDLSNWAAWASTPNTYWLHVEARDARTKASIGSQTIAFAYQAGTTKITGTYAGWRSDGILLGAVSNNPKATTKIKIYDTATQQWVAQFDGPWAMWHPVKGVYWTHFEVYTSDGRLVQTLTYAFGV